MFYVTLRSITILTLLNNVCEWQASDHAIQSLVSIKWPSSPVASNSYTFARRLFLWLCLWWWVCYIVRVCVYIYISLNILFVYFIIDHLLGSAGVYIVWVNVMCLYFPFVLTWLVNPNAICSTKCVTSLRREELWFVNIFICICATVGQQSYIHKLIELCL